ncbi:hypothetical protein AAFP35_05035 [Gordonia sp. CPCC 206044]|uniref:hypothetical protein n=1 Tax=Gordonia sp. CPCC 206044 TaxID=3140793 RepID=UPI003AF3C660
MSETLTMGLRRSVDQGYRRPMALLEAIEVEEIIVIPGLDAILDSPHLFGLSFDSSIALSGVLRAHVKRVGVLRTMILDALGEMPCPPEDLKHIPAALPVRAVRSVLADGRWAAAPRGRAVVSVAFAFVAVHALTDPTDCGTASRALNLRPRPLHDDRALLQRVLSAALPSLGAVDTQLLSLYIGKASAFFADPDLERWGLPFCAGDGDVRDSSLLDYNPDALTAGCRLVGLDTTTMRLAQRP